MRRWLSRKRRRPRRRKSSWKLPNRKRSARRDVTPSQQRLTSDLICRGLRVVGAHDTLNDERWNNATITEYFFQLVQQGRFPLAGLTTHVVPAAEYARAYRIANERRGETMGIVKGLTRLGPLSA